MKILVCVKHVPDTETKIVVAGNGTSIEEAGVKWSISPYDEYAMEEAIRLKEAAGEGEVVVVCAGRDAAQSSLRQMLAMGADRGIHVADGAVEAVDGLTRARLLSKVVEAEAPNMVLVGKYGVGMDESQTGPMLAELLDWAHSAAVNKLDVKDGAYEAHRQVEGSMEIQQGNLPAVITCDKGLNEPRRASIKAIMQAKKKPIDKKSAADLGADLADSGVTLEKIVTPAARTTGKLIEGSPADAARELVRLLREEAKVI